MILQRVGSFRLYGSRTESGTSPNINSVLHTGSEPRDPMGAYGDHGRAGRILRSIYRRIEGIRGIKFFGVSV